MSVPENLQLDDSAACQEKTSQTRVFLMTERSTFQVLVGLEAAEVIIFLQKGSR